MATTRTLIATTVFGNKRVHLFKVTDTSYPTGVGISMTAALCGMDVIDMLIPFPSVATWLTSWDRTAATVHLWITTSAAEYNSTAGEFFALVIGS